MGSPDLVGASAASRKHADITTHGSAARAAGHRPGPAVVAASAFVTWVKPDAPTGWSAGKLNLCRVGAAAVRLVPLGVAGHEGAACRTGLMGPKRLLTNWPAHAQASPRVAAHLEWLSSERGN
jgi:hypothetical protein